MKLIILDRDGVINFDTHYIKSPEEWSPIPGSVEAIARLHQQGYTIVVATNQSGIGRGFFDEETLTRIHHKMHTAVEALGGRIDKIYYCSHLPEAHCHCRKPKPGLFEQIATDYGIALHDVYAVGDSLRDIQVAISVGARPILVLTGKGSQTLQTHPTELALVPYYPSLWDALEHIEKA